MCPETPPSRNYTRPSWPPCVEKCVAHPGLPDGYSESSDIVAIEAGQHKLAFGLACLSNMRRVAYAGFFIASVISGAAESLARLIAG